MKNKKGNKLSKKANGVKAKISFATTKAAKKFYDITSAELQLEELISVGGKISYKLKGTKVILKGNRFVAMDMIKDIDLIDN